MKLSLWPHQQKAITEIESSWNSGINRVLFQLSTGGGKSRIIRAITDIHYNSKKVIYILAHRDNLIDQLSEEITEQGIKHGIIKSGYPYIKYRVQVCSIQTLARRLGKVEDPEIIIIDECHHIKANQYLNVLKKWPDSKILGVTATPARTDGKGLGDIFQKLIIGPPMKELIVDGYLADYDYFAPDDVDMSGVARSHGEFKTGPTIERVDKKIITGSAVLNYKKHANHKPGIACCVNIAHAEHVAEQFRDAGYIARAVHSKMSKEYIKSSIAGLRDGSVEVLCQCELLGEGVDIKGAVALIGLRPTASLIVFLQHAGRVLRAAPGKRAVIIDHVNNWLIHDLPDDDREWSLESNKRPKEESKYKRCPQCQQVVKKTEKICPFCNFLWRFEPLPPVIPQEKEGTLVNVKGRVRGDLVLKIARKARNLKQAIKIARDSGATHGQAWKIWTHDLKNVVDKK